MKTSIEKGLDYLELNYCESDEKTAIEIALQDFAEKVEKEFIENVSDEFIGMKERWKQIKKQEGLR